MSKALPSILAIAACGAVAFALIQYNARSAAEAADAERKRSLAAAEQSLRDALDAAARARDELAAEKENVARLKKERDDALAKSKLAAASVCPCYEIFIQEIFQNCMSYNGLF